MPDCKFKVGDRVAVKSYSSTVDIRHVKRVMKMFVELDDGTKWQPSGYGHYPRANFDNSGIHLFSAEQEEAIERDVFLRKVQYVGWKQLTTDQLRRVMAIVNEGKGEANG